MAVLLRFACCDQCYRVRGPVATASTGALLADDLLTLLSPDGHFSNPQAERDLVSVVQNDKGQETLTPEEFAHKDSWKNDPDKVRLPGK